MGRLRKRFNEKGRASSHVCHRRGNEDNVKVELQGIEEEKYDESNALVLSGDKTKQKVSHKVEQKVKILSRKQRKLLEKVIERKQKKINRAELLEKLSLVQAKTEETNQLCSTSSVHTAGLKKFIKNPSLGKVNNLKGLKSSQTASKRLKIEYDLEEDSSCTSSDEEDVPANKLDDVLSDKDSVIEPAKATDDQGKLSSDHEDEKQTNTVEKTSSVADIPVKDCNVVKEAKETVVEHAPAVFVQVTRQPEIQAARQALPIFCEEQALVEAIKENQVVIIHGETGSGKTTQVPQFLYEAGFTLDDKMIGITEPRRIAAITMASRVGLELNMPEKVSYHIRYKRTTGTETEIKFMTDGVLLQEIKHDFFLTKYSVLIIDEAHERSVFSDVLIGLLSRIVPVRAKRNNPLKLIIMSATIRVQDFTENSKLFKNEPLLIKLESRQYRVQVHFNKVTPDDYIESAYNKVCKIHRTLPPGAILVFLTGENEILKLIKRLRRTFVFPDDTSEVQLEVKKDDPESETKQRAKRKRPVSESGDSFISLGAEINLDNYPIQPLTNEDLQHQDSDAEEDGDVKNYKVVKDTNDPPLYVLPLYSFLDVKEQQKVFDPPPAGARLCVVSTNVAETSITIPGLKYVVDSGKVKRKVYNRTVGGISRFDIDWCSKASSNQRAGRCGRTEGGHCYRLYSSAVFENDLPDYEPPDIQKMPADDVLLQMKALGIDRVVEFPFPSPPEKDALMAAERRLVALGALEDLQKSHKNEDIKKWEFSAKVTPLGKKLSRFPLSPRYAKMLLLSHKHNCIPHLIAIVCALTVPEVFITSTTTVEENDLKFMSLGDVMVLLRTVALYKESKCGNKFCLRNGVRQKAMAEIDKMYSQLIREMNREFPDLSLERTIPIPTEEEVEKIRKIIAICFIDHVARRIPREDTQDDKCLKNAYKCLDSEDPVFIHPASVLFEKLPEYVIYSEIIESSKLYMKGVVEIEPEWLALYAPDQCTFKDPQEDPPPSYDVRNDKILCRMGGTFGRHQWPLPILNMEMPKSLLKYSWFCTFFLGGEMFPKLAVYRQDLLSQPSVMIKSWAKLLPRTRYLLQAVIGKEIDSKRKLMQIWEENPLYLQQEFLQWIPENKHFELSESWPPV